MLCWSKISHVVYWLIESRSEKHVMWHGVLFLQSGVCESSSDYATSKWSGMAAYRWKRGKKWTSSYIFGTFYAYQLFCFAQIDSNIINFWKLFGLTVPLACIIAGKSYIPSHLSSPWRSLVRHPSFKGSSLSRTDGLLSTRLSQAQHANMLHS